MPDISPQPLNPIATAQDSGLIKPDDAAWVSQRASQMGVDPATLGYNLGAVRKEWQRLDTVEQWDRVAANPDLAAWMVQGRNAAMVQDDLTNVMHTNALVRSLDLPDPAGIGEQAWSTFKQSARVFGRGVAALGAVAMEPRLSSKVLFGTATDEEFEDSSLAALSKWAEKSDENVTAEQSDIAQRTFATGGNRLHLVVGSVLGQAPEMLATGFGLARVGGTVATTVMRAGKGAVIARGAALTAGEMKAALAAASFAQGGYEGARQLADRVVDNAQAGTDLVTWRDVAASAVTAGVVMATEVLGGMSGEMRMLAGPSGTTWRMAGRDLIVQPGQEALQEFIPSVTNDLIDGKDVDWNEAKWAGIAGAVGGGMFAGPAVIGAAFSGVSRGKQQRAAEMLAEAQKLVNVQPAAQNAAAVGGLVNTLAQSKALSTMSREQYVKMLREAHGLGNAEQHFTAEDFGKLATAMEQSTDELASDLGARVEAGNVSVPTADLAYALAVLNKPDVTAAAVGSARVAPDAQSLTDAVETVSELDKRLEAIEKRYTEDKPVMPDGTPDDSADVRDAVEQSLLLSGREAQMAKRDANIIAEQARVDAELWNEEAEASGREKITPKQLWDKHGAQFLADGDVVWAATEGSVGGFVTAKGSSYVVGPDGRTTRTKSLHAGHDKSDVGKKPISEATYYMDPAHARALGAHQSLNAPDKGILVNGSRAWPVTMSGNGKIGVAVGEREGYPLSTTPSVGASPLELWKPSGRTDGGEGKVFLGWHPGNAIVSMSVDIGTAQSSGSGNRGTYDLITRIIRLGKKQDASTVMHEMMHHWLERHRKWASLAGAPTTFNRNLTEVGGWAKENAPLIAAHYNGTKPAGAADVSADEVRLAASNMLELDISDPGGMAIHEGLAWAYEQYIMEGKSPTKGMRRVFEQISKFVRKVYRNIVRVDLLTDDTRKVFDRMLRASDRVERGSFTVQTAEKLGISPGEFALIEQVRSDALADARAKVLDRLTKNAQKRADENTAAERQAIEDDLVERFKTRRDYRTILAMRQDPVDLAAMTALLDAAGIKQVPKEKFKGLTVDGGADPAAVAMAMGYENPVEMATELATAPDFGAIIEEQTELRMSAPELTPSEQAALDLESAEGRALVAAAEKRAVVEALRLSKVKDKGAKAKDVFRKKAAELVNQARWDVAAARKVLTDRAKRVAEAAKLKKQQWLTDAADLQQQMKDDTGQPIIDALAEDAVDGGATASTLQDAIENGTRKVAKLASKGDFAGALIAYGDVEVATSAMRLLVEQPKTELAATIALEAKKDYAYLRTLADRRVAVLPAITLRTGRAASIANQARRKAEKALAKQDVAAYEQAKLDEAAAEAMEAAVIDAIEHRKKLGASVKKGLSDTVRSELESGGQWITVEPSGNTVIHPSDIAAFNHWSSLGGDPVRLTRGEDLVTVRDGINALMKVPTHATGVKVLLAASGDRLLGADVMLPAFLDLIKTNPDPGSWTLTNWSTVEYQVRVLSAIAAERKANNDIAVQDEATILAGLPAKSRAGTPRDPGALSGVLRGAFMSGENWRTHLLPLGPEVTALFVDGGNKAQMDFLDASEQASSIVRPLAEALPRSMGAKITVRGIETTRWEQMGRLMHWGSASGRKRVINDLRLRYGDEDTIRAKIFIDELLSSVTPEEAAFLNGFWSAFDVLWKRQLDVVKRNGAPIPPSIEPLQFQANGHDLSGGYARVKYIDETVMEDYDLSTGPTVAQIDSSMLHERTDMPPNRRLNLEIDVQHYGVRSHAKYIAYMPWAKRVSNIMRNARVERAMRDKMGDDWWDDLKGYINFTINGLRPPEYATPDMVFSHLRRTISTMTFAFNLLTAPKQAFGLVNSAGHPAVGTRAVLSAAYEYLRAPNIAAENIRTATQGMRQRAVSQDVDLRAPDKIVARSSVLDSFENLGKAPMRWVQWQVDAITFLAAYNKARAGGKTEAQAKRIADTVVIETQGSTLNAEAARINRTHAGQFFTVGFKWCLNNANYLTRLARSVRADDRASQVAFGKAVIIGAVVSTAAMNAFQNLLQPADGDEGAEPGDFATKVSVDILSSLHIFLRHFVPLTMAAWEGDSRRAADAALGMPGAPIKSTISLFQEMGDDNPDIPRMVKASVSLAGAATGIPAAQINRSVNAVTDDSDNAWEAFLKALFGEQYVAP